LPNGISAVVFSPGHKQLAVVIDKKSVALLDPATLQIVGTIGPLADSFNAMRYVDVGDGPEKWLVSGGGNELRLWDLAAREERFKLDVSTAYGHDNIATSPDGSLIYSPGCGRVNLGVARLRRETAQNAALSSRAAWCAEWGAWAWARELLLREKAAGRAPPPLLLARAEWMCGEKSAARRAFQMAADRGEIPPWYAKLCASAGEEPIAWTAIQPARKPADVIPGMADVPLPSGVIAASDVKKILSLMSKEVTVEGDVIKSTWNLSGKHLNMEFASSDPSKMHLFCRISHKIRKELDAKCSGDAASAMSGARVRIHGTVIEYNGSWGSGKGCPQIDIDEPADVTIVR
jgi:hypothetical protein